MNPTTPWHKDKTYPYIIRDANHNQVATVRGDNHDAGLVSDQIVRAVNAHDDLLAACKTALSQVEAYNRNPQGHDPRGCTAELREAIAKAEGGA